MEFTVVSDAIGAKAYEVVKYILGQNWSDSQKKKALIRLFRQTGDAFYEKLFTMGSDVLDSAALKSLGFDNPDNQIERMAAKTIQNHNLSRSNAAVTTEFYYSVSSDALSNAFRNARSLDKHPVLTRRTGGKCCKWCSQMAGTYINPTSEVFRHHENCNCIFEYSSPNTRKGKYKGHAPNRYERREQK